MYSAQPTPPKDIRVMSSLNKIILADPQDDCDDDLPIEVFIGADYYWKIVTMERPIRVCNMCCASCKTHVGFLSSMITYISRHEVSIKINDSIKAQISILEAYRINISIFGFEITCRRG